MDKLSSCGCIVVLIGVAIAFYFFIMSRRGPGYDYFPLCAQQDSMAPVGCLVTIIIILIISWIISVYKGCFGWLLIWRIQVITATLKFIIIKRKKLLKKFEILFHSNPFNTGCKDFERKRKNLNKNIIFK